jgi:hypothetical protein
MNGVELGAARELVEVHGGVEAVEPLQVLEPVDGVDPEDADHGLEEQEP